MDTSFTLVVTSCGRFDLLRRTLESFAGHADMAPADVIVVEDSGDGAVADVVHQTYPRARVLINDEQLGQMRSIDRAYASLTHPFVFHCEDDWAFERTGFLAQSFALLEALSQASLVGLRPRQEQNPRVRDARTETIAGVACYRLDPSLHPEYFSYSFNPGLRRLADYRALAPLARLGGEADVSYAFKQKGFFIVNLEEHAVRHIGDERHVDDPAQPKRARTLPERLVNSGRKRMKRLRRWWAL
ncbi:MAG: glycosyltransferase [Pseudomonadota bacterium]